MMKTKISVLILTVVFLSGCFLETLMVVSGFNTLYNGIQTYKSLKQDIKDMKKEKVKSKPTRSGDELYE